MVEYITHGGRLLSIIIRNDYQKNGIEFFSPDNFSQQIGYMKRPKDYVIPPHKHNTVRRDVLITQEVLFIKSGVIRVDFYDDDKNYLESSILKRGDIVLLAYGGHGFEMIKESEIIEVKQGPYLGEKDKVRFDSIPKEKLIIRNV